MIIVFREVMEAGLIVGIVLAATEGVAGRGRWIAGGIAAGVAGASLVAVFAAALFNMFEGAGQEVFTAAILLFAVAMLTWHVGWMSHHGRAMAAEIREVGQAVRLGHRSLAALAVVVTVAVLREGSEVVLFLFGIAAASSSDPVALAAGGVAGLAMACVVSWLLYRGLVAIPLRHLFNVTNTLIALLAAGMAGQAVAVLHGADLLPAWGEQLWDTSWLLADDTFLGRSLHALVGYSARPSGIQLAAWLGTLLMLATLSRVVGRPKGGKPVRPVVAAAMLLAGLMGGATHARAEDPVVQLQFRQHRFIPDHLTVPANAKFRVLVTNNDDTADEFESVDLNREKLVPPGQTIIVFLGPLPPGEYKFFGDFHQDTAQGVMVAK
jgi:high-affinity iron transporter